MTDRPHVCLLTSGRVFEIHYGGEGGFTRSIGKWLTEHGHEVTIMGSSFVGVRTRHLSANNEEEYCSTKLNRGHRVRVVYPPYFVYFLSRVFLSLMWIIRILVLNMRHPVTLIHAQDTGYAGLAAIISGKILQIPVIISSHGIRHKSLESIIQGAFRRFLLKAEYNLDIFSISNADSIIVISPVIKKYFEGILPQKTFYFIPTPINVRAYQFSELNRKEVRGELGIEETTMVIGYVGRMSPEKNLLTLLEAFAKVVKEISSAKLLLVGAGILESQLRTYVVSSGLENNVIFGGVRYDIGRLLSGFDLFVLPSYTEGLGSALLEAMACGRPSIVSNIATFREVVRNEREALLINPHNSEELGNAIMMLIRDPTLRQKLSSNAKTKAATYDQDIIFPTILELYMRILRQKLK